MYALNIRKGTTVNHPDVKLPGLVAVPVDDDLAMQLKNIHDIVVFEKVAGIGRDDSKSKIKPMYGLNKNTLEVEK